MRFLVVLSEHLPVVASALAVACAAAAGVHLPARPRRLVVGALVLMIALPHLPITLFLLSVTDSLPPWASELLAVGPSAVGWGVFLRGIVLLQHEVSRGRGA